MIKMLFKSFISLLIVVSFTDAFPQVSPTLDPGKDMLYKSYTILYYHKDSKIRVIS